MNERIKQLADKVRFVDSDKEYPDQDEIFEGFAKLIIQECIDNLEFHGHDKAVSQLEWLRVNRFGIKS